MGTDSNVRTWLRERKDSSVSFLLKKMLQKNVEAYGKILELKLDTRTQRLEVEMLLKGEENPVRIVLTDYHLDQTSRGSFLTVNQASASREWINLLLADFLVGRAIRIPESYAAMARMVL